LHGQWLLGWVQREQRLRVEAAMKRNIKKPLALARETLRSLEAAELAPTRGGGNVQSGTLNQCSVGVYCTVCCNLVGWWH
jgi:hypothetical protein